MKPFLYYVAEDILAKYGSDLSGLTVVFPNKRASLFLSSHLAQLSQKPIWSPAYTTISDLFRRHSPFTAADPIKLVCDLHKSFVRQTGIDETLDHFYGWGELLLSDFDDIDKNLADADRVLANLRDLRELDDVSYLTDQQKQAIARFFSNFSEDHNTLLRERFIRLWSHMADIYHDFNQSLSAQGLAYEGALYRDVVEHRQWQEESACLFVGFNLLQGVEQRLFTMLRQQGKARFYWDFDHYYMDGHEAGHFIARQLADFPNELDTSRDDIYSRFRQPKTVRLISAPTENIQARYASQWLLSDGRIAAGRQTAIVLGNEQLLQTVIHCLPDAVEKVNVTTGYPLSQSPVSSLVSLMFSLQTAGQGGRRDRIRQHRQKALLRHPYLSGLPAETTSQLLARPTDSNAEVLQWMCDVLQAVARCDADGTASSVFVQEAVFRAWTLLNRLLTLVSSGDLQVDIVTLQRLTGQLIQTATIPFHGEPAEGTQVMGILETRCLDFDHLLLLSCNEGNLPRGVSDTSFIPYSLRKAYGLTTVDHKVAIFSYYFHRLLQRASDVTIVYNNATTDGQTGEMSRFLLQLMVEDRHHHIQQQTLQAGQQITPFHPQPVEKTEAVMQALRQRFDRRLQAPSDRRPLLSPTAINSYLRCPLSFYYIYVHGLREPDTTVDDTIDNRIFGNIFHEASRLIYSRLTEQSPQLQADDIDRLLKSRVDIERAVDQAFRTELFQVREPQANFRLELNGLQLINREVIIHYLRQLLSIDRQLAPFTIIGLETDVMASLKTDYIDTVVGGRIDRLDMVQTDGRECIRVVDYKTGSRQPKPLAGVEAIFRQDSLQNHSDYYLQTFLYGCIVRRRHPETAVAPALLFIQHTGTADYSPILKFGRQSISDVRPYQSEFARLLRETVDEMFNPAIAFAPTSDRQRCLRCPYRQLCTG